MIGSSLKKPSIVTVMMVLVFACQDRPASRNYDLPQATVSEKLNIVADSIEVQGNLGAFSVSKKIEEEVEGIQLITFSFSAESPSELQPATIQFKFPSIDINGFWNPKIGIDKVNYYYSGFSAKASRNAPVLSFYNNSLNNRVTIALSDAINKSEFESYLKEEDVHFYPIVKLFEERMPKTTFYEVTIRIDTRMLPYHKVIDDVASWWAKDARYKPLNVPDAAKRPMYSTWYSYHQSISSAEIVAECKIAKSLGCEAVIVDDGWQTNDANRGYAYTGDWNPDRIPDMKGFVDAVHEEGMKFLLWYSVPFMGEKAKNYSKFKGKYLRHWESQNTYVMDPRYPEVRKYIVNTYTSALTEWGLDGFKLDFIGWFAANEETKLTKKDGRDFASVNEATDVLMTEITTQLKSLKPDILLEFRQPYIGPVMRKYGNMFRGVDAPNNAVANKVETVNLRILSQNTAVHSDMFIWRKEESVEQAALQILNILYSVPQLSVRLAEIPETHLGMIRNWFEYWNANREVLLDGDFIPSNPGANYPSITAIKSGHQITTVYDDVVVFSDKNFVRLDVINATANSRVTLRLEEGFKGVLTVKDAMGSTVFEDNTSLSAGIHDLKIPQSGIAIMEAMKK